MAAGRSMVGLEVSDDGLNGLVPFEQPTFLIGESLVFDPVLDLNLWVVFVHAQVS